MTTALKFILIMEPVPKNVSAHCLLLTIGLRFLLARKKATSLDDGLTGSGFETISEQSVVVLDMVQSGW